MVTDEYTSRGPAAALRPYVASYCGYRQDGVPPSVHRGLPSPYLTVILTLDDPLELDAHPDPRQSPGRYDTLAGGLHTTPALIRNPGRQSGVQVAVHPLGCRALFGRPAAELANVDVDLTELLPAWRVAALREAMLAAPGWAGRFAAVDAALLALAREASVPAEVAYAYDRLVRDGGTTRVGALAAEVGWSARHLTARFRAEVGLRPKEMARVARFDRARRRLHPGVRVADVAAVAGYYDQAHLAREFQDLAGCSPSRWMADEFGFVQATHGPVAQDGGYE